MSQQILNQSAGATQTANFTGLTPGNYRLHVDLTDSSGGAGSVTGQLDLVKSISMTAPTVISSAVGGTATKLEVAPSNLSLTLDSAQPLYASAVQADGRYTFLSTTGVNWSTTGSAVTVDTAGHATAVLAGTSTVRATDPVTSLSATTTITVPSPPRTKWTVLVFLDASNDLQPYSVLNMNQMERLGGNSDVRFVVQWKQYKPYFPDSTFDGTRRYLVNKDSTDAITSTLISDLGTNVDMGNATTLRQFVDWGKSHYPADHTLLMLWDHGSGWAQRSPLPKTRTLNYDTQYGSVMNVQDIGSALSGQHLDVIAIDACLMQQIEVATELQNAADFVVASEELTPGPGYIYNKCFQPFFDAPTSDVLNLCNGIVNAQVNEPSYATQDITQSTLDTTKISGLNLAIDNLAGTLITNVASMGTTMAYVRANAHRFDPTSSFEFYYDLYDVCQKLRDSATCPSDVKAAATTVQQAVNSAVRYANHSTSMANTYGIAIDLSPATFYQPTKYGALKFAQTTRWSNWLAVAP